MSDHDHRSEQPDPATTQAPHVPGQSPGGSGLPRQRDAKLPTAPGSDEDEKKSAPPGEEDAPLGGSEVTEDELTADTEVERDALKSLDPDDTPA
ncbi:hypothetical protein [Microbacterium alcoholitolerans]|uniref:hypothetical protein n=1 Tax=unclassified Microbacterium TaxID=2609290 RepID=UPI003D16DD25